MEESMQDPKNKPMKTQMNDSMSKNKIDASQIKPETPVVCSNNMQFAVVDHMQGSDMIKLNKDDSGKHHFIPLSWVTSVDDKVHIDRPGDQAMREWKTESRGQEGAA